MATIRLVGNFRVKPGRYVDLFEGIKALKNVTGRLGASMVVNRQVAGPETGNILMVVVFADWAAYAKAAADPELVRLVDAMRNNPNPAYDAITVSLNEEVAL